MRALALVLLLAVCACAHGTSSGVQPTRITPVSDEDCLTPPDNEGACVLRNPGIVL